MADGMIAIDEYTESTPTILWWVTRFENDDDSGWKIEAPDAKTACDLANAKSNIVDAKVPQSMYREAVPYFDRFPSQRPTAGLPATA